MGKLEREIAELRARLELVEELAERLEARILDLRSIERRLAAAVHGVRLVLAPGEEADAYVRWLERRGRDRRANLVLAAAPIELGAVLRESLFTRVEAAVLTSATLATNRRFDFLRSRLGLEAAEIAILEEEVEVEERIVMSPFDFTTQTMLGVPTDLPPLEHGEAFDGATAGIVAGPRRDYRRGALRPVHVSRRAEAGRGRVARVRNGHCVAALRAGRGRPASAPRSLRALRSGGAPGHDVVLGGRWTCRGSPCVA